MNMQAVVDANNRFTWASILTCGSSHDVVALELSDLGISLTNSEHPVQAVMIDNLVVVVEI